ncbi:LysR family transcriptional regulator [Pandoraea horticolens]|uniref:LysR family transcriptional regulator n=1 Tax=Pandoraea horticolens TaxID=2508298 RepID=A0A5E4W849_9BURK|nr:LysR family transcriptional regulator [Pandoraea horticolens]VVE20808.1 LysR family transcriptional regulator [Pandoraea horticolens]
MKKRTDLDVRSLRIFEAVASAGSLSGAAGTLGITQSAISQAIAQVEQTVGTRVLDRSRRPLKLTPAGLALSRHARQIVDDMDRLIAQVQDADVASRAAVRVGMIDSFAATVGPSIVRQMSGSTSELLLWSGLANGHAQALLARHLDLIVTSDPMNDMERLVRRPIFTEPFVVVVPKAREADLAKADLSELIRSLPLIRFSGRSHFGAVIERHLRRTGHSPRMHLEIDTSDIVMSMVAADLGFTIATPMCLLQGRASLPKLAALPLPGPALSRTIYQVSREGEVSEMASQCFLAGRLALTQEAFPELRRIMPWLGERLTLC